jgi:hypothetical protein
MEGVMNSNKQVIVSLMAVIAILLCGTMLLQAKDYPMGIAPKQTITFSQPTIVGGNLLPAGQYKVTHEMQGQTHIMNFQQVGGKATATSKCNLMPLAEKASKSEQRFADNAKNERVLIQMTFRGDKATHVLEP